MQHSKNVLENKGILRDDNYKILLLTYKEAIVSCETFSCFSLCQVWFHEKH